MTHYGIAGFGTAAGYAQALGLEGDTKLKDATKETYGGDEFVNRLAETTEHRSQGSVSLRVRASLWWQPRYAVIGGTRGDFAEHSADPRGARDASRIAAQVFNHSYRWRQT